MHLVWSVLAPRAGQRRSVDHAVDQVVLVPNGGRVVPGEVDDPDGVQVDLNVLVDNSEQEFLLEALGIEEGLQRDKRVDFADEGGEGGSGCCSIALGIGVIVDAKVDDADHALGDCRGSDHSINLQRVRSGGQHVLQSLKNDLRIDVFQHPLGRYLSHSISLHQSDPHLAGDVVQIGEILTHDDGKGFVTIERSGECEVEEEGAGDHRVVDGEIDLRDIDGEVLSHRRNQNH